jgi:photosystem I protein
MATQTKISKKPVTESAVAKTGKPPYTFRTAWALLLLAGNFLIAAIYFHVWNI